MVAPGVVVLVLGRRVVEVDEGVLDEVVLEDDVVVVDWPEDTYRTTADPLGS